MTDLKLYKIVVIQIVDELSDCDDKESSPEGAYHVHAKDEDGALDWFHENIPIGALEDFGISITVENQP